MKNINKYLKSSVVLAAFVYSVGTTTPMQSTYADEINTELVNNETIKEWKPEGKVIETGEDGVPWELYENGYLLFKPEPGKEILGKFDSEWHFENTKLFHYRAQENQEWKEFKDKIKAISFSDKTYLPTYPPNLLGGFQNLEFFDGENLNVSKIDSLYALFLGDEKLNNVKLENWDVSHIRTFRGMFAGTSIKKLDLSKWNFSEAPNSTKRDLFGSAESLEEITLPESFFNLTEQDKKYFENNISIWSITGLHSNPQKTNIHNDKWVRKEDKKEINDFSELKMNDKSNAGTWTRRYKRIVFRDLEIKDIVSFDDELNNQELPLPKNPPENEKNNIVFKGWTNFEYRWDKPIKIYKTVSDVLNAYEGKENYYYVDLKTEWGTVDNTKKETKIIPIETKYIPNTELEPNKNEIESKGKEGQKEIVTTYQVTPITGELTNPSSTENIITPMQPKIIKVGTKPKIETIKNNNQTIERTTNYTVDEKTGELTETITDKLISISTPLISNPNGNDEPELNINNKPEYKEDVSTNTPSDENNNSILPPIVNELPEYKGQLSTNTPIDDNGDLILPPTVEKPEFNGNVNSTEPPMENKPEFTSPISTNTPLDENGNLILPPVVNDLPEFNGNINHTETLVNEVSENTVPSNNSKNAEKLKSTKEEIKKERELPNTNSTSILTTLVSSVIDTLGLGYKSKRRK